MKKGQPKRRRPPSNPESWRLPRSGGFDGRLREWALEAGALSPRGRKVLLQSRSLRPARTPARDMIQYRFTWVRGARQRTFMFDERTLPAALRADVARITGEGSSLA